MEYKVSCGHSGINIIGILPLQKLERQPQMFGMPLCFTSVITRHLTIFNNDILRIC